MAIPSQSSVNQYVNEGLSPEKALAYATDEVNNTGAFTPATEAPSQEMINPTVVPDVLKQQVPSRVENKESGVDNTGLNKAQGVTNVVPTKAEKVDQASADKAALFAQAKSNVDASRLRETELANTKAMFSDELKRASQVGSATFQQESKLPASMREQFFLDASKNRALDRDTDKNALFSDYEIAADGKIQLANTAMALAGRTAQIPGELFNLGVNIGTEVEFNAQGFTESDIKANVSLDKKLKKEAKLTKELSETKDPLRKAEIEIELAGVSRFNYSDEEAAQFVGNDQGFGNINLDGSRITNRDAFTKYTSQVEIQDEVAQAAAWVQEYVNTTNVDDVISEGKTAFDETQEPLSVNGILSLGAKGLGILANSPEGVLQAAVSTLPDAVTAAKSLVLAAGSAMSRTQQEALKAFEKEYGNIPLDDDRAKLNAYSVLAGIVDVAGDVLLGKALKLGKVAKPSTAKGDVLNVPVSAAGEFVAESGAALAGDMAGVQDVDKLDVGSAFGQGLVGFGAGGTLSTLGAAKGVAAELSAEPLKKAAKEQFIKQTAADLTPTQTAAKQAAVETGDLSAVTDSSASDYSLKTALTAILERGTNDLSTEERETNLNTARQLAAEEFQKLQDSNVIVQELKEQDKPDALAEAEDVFSQILVNFKASRNIIDAITEQGTLKSKDVNQQIKAVEQGDAEQANQAATEIRRSFRANPASITIKQAENVISRGGEKLTQEVIQEFTNHIATRKAVEEVRKTSGQVANDIVDGGKGFRGINQFLTSIAGQLNIGKEKEAKTDLVALARFAQGHFAKAKEFEAAHEAVLSGSAPIVTSIKKLGKEFVTVDGKVTDQKSEDTAENNFVIHRNSGKQIALIQAEAELLGKSLKQANEMINPTAPVVEEAVKEGIVEPEVLVVEDTTTTPEAEQAPVRSTEEVVEADLTIPNFEDQFIGEPDDMSYFDTLDSESLGMDDMQEAPPIIDMAPENAQAFEEVLEVESNAEINEEMDATEKEYVAEETIYNLSSDLTNRPVAPRPTLEDIKNDKTLIGKWYKSVNLISAMFTARTKDVEDQGLLHTLPNAMETLRQGYGAVRNVLGRAITNGERTNLDTMVNFDNDIQESFIEALGSKADAFKYKSLTQFLLNDDGTVDANVVSTISTALYNFMATRASDTLVNTQEDYRAILGKDDDHVFQAGELAKLDNTIGLVGSVRGVVANDLGKAVYKSLGLTTTGDAFKNLDPNMELALGQLGINLLLKTGHMKEEARNITEFFTSAPGVEVNSKQTTRFIRIAAVTGLNGEEVAPASQVIIDANKLAPKLSTELFATKSYKVGPALEPIEQVVTTMKGTNQRVPKRIQAILAKKQKEKHYVKQDALDVVAFLGNTTMARILGFRTEDDIAKLHTANRNGAKGINLQALKSLEHMEDLMAELDGDASKPIYFGNFVAKQLRNHLDSNTVNPQGNKFHRFMVAHGNQIIEVPFGSDADNRIFWTAVEFLDMKTADQVKATLADATHPISIAVAAMAQVLQGSKEPELANAIEAGVNSAGHKAQSLDMIMALAKRQIAVEAGLTSYPTNISEEIDGKTNGVIIGLLQLNSGSLSPEDFIKTLNKGGFFTKEDGVTNIPDWESNPLNNDAYKELAIAWNDAVKATEAPQEFIKALEKVLGTLTELQEDGSLKITGRSLSKNPLMVSVYGSGNSSIKSSLVDTFVANFHKQVQDIVNDESTDETTKFTLLSDLDIAVSTVAGRRLYDQPTTAQEALDVMVIKASDVADSVNMSYGEGLVEAIDAKYQNFKDTRKVLNNSMNVAHTIHQEMYDYLYNRILNHYHNEGIIDKTLMDLPKDTIKRIEKEVEGALPRMHNYFSKKEGTLESGTNTQKSDLKQNIDNDVYAVETPKVPGSPGSVTYGYSRITSAPGVSPAIMGIHGTDASTIYLLHEAMEVIGVHDAALFSLDEATAGGKKFNELFLEVMSGISLTEEANRTLLKADASLKAFEKRYGANLGGAISANLLDQNTFNGDNGPFVPEDAILSIEQALMQSKFISNKATKNKEDVIAATDFVDQYSMLGGGSEFSTKAVAPSDEAATNQTQEVIDQVVHQSTQEDIDIDNFEADETMKVDSLNSIEIFEALEAHNTITEDASHQAYLKTVLNNLVNKAIGSFDLHIGTNRRDIENVGATTGDNVYIETLKGNSTHGSGILAQGVVMSAQEVYVHELAHNITAQGIKVDQVARKELVRIFRHAKANLDYTAFLTNPDLDVNDPANAEAVTAAKARYEYVFTPFTNADGKTSQHLDEFLAFALTNKNFGASLEGMSLPKADGLMTELKGKDVFQVLGILFNRCVTFLISASTGTRKSENVKAAVTELTKRFADIDRAQKSLIMKSVEMSGAVVQKGVGVLLTSVVYSARKLANVDFIANSNLPGPIGSLIRSASNIVKATDTSAPFADKSDFGQVFGQLTGTLDKVKYGLTKALMTEAKGLHKGNGVFHRLARLRNNFVDRARTHTSNTIKRLVLKTFEGGLSAERSEALYRGVLKTDLSSIINTYGYSKVQAFYADSVVLEAEIDALNIQLDTYQGYGTFFNNAAESMGHQMVTGKALVEHHLMNAYNVSTTVLDGKQEVSTALQPVVEEAVNKLASLYAIKYTNQNTKNIVNDLMTNEEAGISMIINLHNELKVEAMERLFDNNPRLFIKGYMKETVNADKAVIMATIEKEEELTKQGYTRQSTNPIKRDPNDPVTEDLFVYVNPHGGLSTYQRGIVSFTGKTAKGTNAVQIQEQLENDNAYAAGTLNDKRTMALKKRSLADMAVNRLNVVNAKEENYMIPTLNLDGSVKGYRYVMSEHSKDTYLEKDNSVDLALGKLAGNMVDKLASTEYNEKTIDALYVQYREDFHKRPDAYVNISAVSDDPRMKDIWQLMPSDTRNYVREVFGVEGMLVREDLVDLVFGQRKLSVVDAFNTEEEKRNLIEKVIVQVASTFMGEKAASKLKIAEGWVQQVVGELKQNIIIKTFFVTLSNALSNSLYLKMAGMSVTNIVKYQSEAYSQAFTYQSDISELDTLGFQMSSTPAKFDTAVNRARIAELRDAIANNPVTELMDAGVLQTIIEDAGIEDIDYTNEKGLVDKITDRLTDKLNTTVKNGVKEFIITRDSKLFKVLNNAAQLSDFSSRYALYKHYTEDAEGDQKFDKEMAISRVMDEFVNFDLPTHKFIQYLNDMGLLWFSKYMIRIQKILAYRLIETPVAAISTLLMADFNGIPTPFDAAVVFNRNPLSAFGTPLTGAESLGNTITVEAIEALIP